MYNVMSTPVRYSSSRDEKSDWARTPQVTPTKHEGGKNSWTKRIGGPSNWKLHPQKIDDSRNSERPASCPNFSDVVRTPKVDVDIPNCYIGPIENKEQGTEGLSLRDAAARSSPMDIPITNALSGPSTKTESISSKARLRTLNPLLTEADDVVVGSVPNDPSPIGAATAEAELSEVSKAHKSQAELNVDLEGLQQLILPDSLPTPLPGTMLSLDDIAEEEVDNDTSAKEKGDKDNGTGPKAGSVSMVSSSGDSGSVDSESWPSCFSRANVNIVKSSNAMPGSAASIKDNISQTPSLSLPGDRVMGKDSDQFVGTVEPIDSELTVRSRKIELSEVLHDAKNFGGLSPRQDVRYAQVDGNISPFDLGSPVPSRSGSVKKNDDKASASSVYSDTTTRPESPSQAFTQAVPGDSPEPGEDCDTRQYAEDKLSQGSQNISEVTLDRPGSASRNGKEKMNVSHREAAEYAKKQEAITWVRGAMESTGRHWAAQAMNNIENYPVPLYLKVNGIPYPIICKREPSPPSVGPHAEAYRGKKASGSAEASNTADTSDNAEVSYRTEASDGPSRPTLDLDAIASRLEETDIVELARENPEHQEEILRSFTGHGSDLQSVELLSEIQEMILNTTTRNNFRHVPRRFSSAHRDPHRYKPKN